MLSEKHPIWDLGFRPFFLLGTLWGSFLLFLWIGIQRGGFSLPLPFSPTIWHAHEMLFSFAVAFVAGFLLTASAQWTGMRGVHGRPLQSLVLLWLLGRLSPFLLDRFPLIHAVVDLSFYLLLAYDLIPYLWQKDQKRNQIFLLLIALLFAGDLWVHADALGFLEQTARKGLLLGLNTILLAIVLIGGRVIPYFTLKRIPGARVQVSPPVEKLSFISVLVFLIVSLSTRFESFTVGVAFFAAAVHLLRWLGWRGWQARGVPILWILFLGYVWVIVGFVLNGLSPFFEFAPGISIHAFTVGGIGVFVYGMVTRVSLGHTGRPIKASAWMVVGYVLINLAALIRVAVPIFRPVFFAAAISISGLLWGTAYLLLFLQLIPILTQPRPHPLEP